MLLCGVKGFCVLQTTTMLSISIEFCFLRMLIFNFEILVKFVHIGSTNKIILKGVTKYGACCYVEIA